MNNPTTLYAVVNGFSCYALVHRDDGYHWYCNSLNESPAYPTADSAKGFFRKSDHVTFHARDAHHVPLNAYPGATQVEVLNNF